jgi:hypothetical protein
MRGSPSASLTLCIGLVVQVGCGSDTVETGPGQDGGPTQDARDSTVDPGDGARATAA